MRRPGRLAPRLSRLATTGRRHRVLWAAAVAMAVTVVVGALAVRWLTADLPGRGQLTQRAAPDTTRLYDRHDLPPWA